MLLSGYEIAIAVGQTVSDGGSFSCFSLYDSGFSDGTLQANSTMDIFSASKKLKAVGQGPCVLERKLSAVRVGNVPGTHYAGGTSGHTDWPALGSSLFLAKPHFLQHFCVLQLS